MMLRLLFLLNDIEIAAVGRILRYFAGYTVGYHLVLNNPQIRN